MNLDRKRCVHCHGEGWVDDQNWSASDPELYFRIGDVLRVPGDGRIPCGVCNFAGWNRPDGKVTRVEAAQ